MVPECSNRPGHGLNHIPNASLNQLLFSKGRIYFKHSSESGGMTGIVDHGKAPALQVCLRGNRKSSIVNPMILGTGIDIIEVARIASSYEKFGERFVNRILHADEIAYCLSHKNPAPFLAVRFAVKEAISKAFGTGIGAQLGWQDMEIRRKESGEPYVVLHGQGKKLFRSRRAKRLLVSLSHTANYAAATAVLER
jgi:holo-[acyl-carrier protein] synthase